MTEKKTFFDKIAQAVRGGAQGLYRSSKAVVVLGWEETSRGIKKIRGTTQS